MQAYKTDKPPDDLFPETMKDKMCAWICVMATVISFLLPSTVFAADTDDDVVILDYEGQNPIVQLTVEQNQTLDQDALPESICAVTGLDAQSDPADFIREEPDKIPPDYTLTENGIYQTPTLDETYPYRIYGTLDDTTGWYSYDLESEKVNGLIQTVPLNWDNQEADLSKIGTTTLKATTVSSSSPRIGPIAQIRVTARSDVDSQSSSSQQSSRQGKMSEVDSSEDDSSEDDRSDETSFEHDFSEDSSAKPSSETDITEHGGKPLFANVDSDSNAGSASNSENQSPVSSSTNSQEEFQGAGHADSDIFQFSSNNHTFEWIGGSADTTFDATSLTNATRQDGINNGFISAKMLFSFSGEQSIAPGALQIKVPLHVLKDRDGNWTDQISLPFPLKSDATGTPDFTYTVDETRNLATITNETPLSSGKFLAADVVYRFTPSKVANGEQTGPIQAVFEIVDPQNGNVLLHETSQTIQATIQTSIRKAENVKKKAINRQGYWDQAWGTAPAGADQYSYTTWQVTATILSGTQPFSICPQETPGLDGEVVGWYTCEPDQLNPNNFVRGDTQDLSRTAVYTTAKDIGPTRKLLTFYVVTRNSLEKLGDKALIENTVVLRSIGVDANTAPIDSDPAKDAYDYEKVEYKYSGDAIGLTKSDLNIGHGAIGMIKNGAVYKPWNAQGAIQNFDLNLTNRSYARSNEGKQDYTTYLDDYLMFIDDQRLEPEDYSFTAFTPSNYKVYDCGTNPDGTLTNVLNTEYSSYPFVK